MVKITTEQKNAALEKFFIGPTITSFDEIDQIEQAEQDMEDVMDTVIMAEILIENIMFNTSIPDKQAAVSDVISGMFERIGSKSKEADSFVDKIIGAIRETISPHVQETKDTEHDGGLNLWKGADGQWRWMATYSNSFQDVDGDVITANSHRNFVRAVDEGSAEMPQLWLHHEEKWRFGKALFVAVDEIDENTVMAVAAGTVDKDKSWLAEAIVKSGVKLKVSHGMPYANLIRNSVDPRYIESHRTTEISPLLEGKEANDLTGFILGKERISMVSDAKRAEYARALGTDEASLVALEDSNLDAASKAAADGRLHKESNMNKEDEGTPEVETKVETEVGGEVKEETVENSEIDALKAQVADLTEAMKAQSDELKEAVLETFGKLGAQLKADREAIEELKKGYAEKASMTPEASLAEQFASAIGSQEAWVDGRTKQAKDGPVETAAPIPNSTGINFLDQLRRNSVANAGHSSAVLNSMGQMAHIQGLNSQGEN